jgi:hypothetical protein
MPDKRKGRPPGDRPANIAPASAGQTPSSDRPVAILRQGADGCYDLACLPAAIAGSIVVHPVSHCWVWTGRTDRDGYGRLGSQGIHRVVYRLLVGEIPADRPILDHQAAAGCIFRSCCFPGHLRPSTIRENTLAGRSFAAINAGKTRCDHGHPYDLFNTYWRPDGHRDCRACIRRRVREYKGRKRAAAAELTRSGQLRQAA